MRLHGLAASLALACLSTSAVAADSSATRVGAEAYGDWRTDAPGVRRLITPADMPALGASPVTSTPSDLIARPAGAWPKAPPGFVVSEFASELKQPRVLRVAPNGDIFVAESGGGRVSVLTAADGAAKSASSAVFASGLNRPYGIAFYPPGPGPHYVYVAETNRIVRYPYKAGDTTASGPAEIVVPSLPVGHHWTRDIAFSPDGKTMFVAVGSGSNIAEDMPPLPQDQLSATFVASHVVGATWGAEENRADVLAFDPDGKNMRVFASGIRNCSALTVQPETSALWCAVNERDLLGDDLPPDYVTRVTPGAFYGWPWFYIGAHPDPRLKGAPAPIFGRRGRPARCAAAAPFGAARPGLSTRARNSPPSTRATPS